MVKPLRMNGGFTFAGLMLIRLRFYAMTKQLSRCLLMLTIALWLLVCGFLRAIGIIEGSINRLFKHEITR